MDAPAPSPSPVSLQPVDAVEVTILVDNVDALLAAGAGVQSSGASL